jgi:hypothetical protein
MLYRLLRGAVFSSANCELRININLIAALHTRVTLILKMEAASFSETLIRSYMSHPRRP